MTSSVNDSSNRSRWFQGSKSWRPQSFAERDLLSRLVEQLDPEFQIISSTGWTGWADRSEGETDLVLAHPKSGLLVVEIKGGHVQVNRAQNGNDVEWTTIGGKDPCRQVDRNREELRDRLGNDPRTRHLSYKIFAAIALPSSKRPVHDPKPDCTCEVFIGLSDMDRLNDRVKEIFAYCNKHATKRDKTMGGDDAVKGLIRLLLPEMDLRPELAEQFKLENRQITRLTQDQYDVLDSLVERRQLIYGGAGTGKTVLAEEKALRLAKSGKRVLFLCFNNNLATAIGRRLKNIPGHDRDGELPIEVFSFQQFVKRYSILVDMQLPDFWGNPQVFFDEAGGYLLQAIKKVGADSPKLSYDSIVIDEAQDFNDDWWISIEELLINKEEGEIYIFMDHSQKLVRGPKKPPLHTALFYLPRNLRNTVQIFREFNQYADDPNASTCDGPSGSAVKRAIPDSSKTELDLLERELNYLKKQKVRAGQIVILTPASQTKSGWKEGQEVADFTLTWANEIEVEDTIRVCSIASFKGLESDAVILTEMATATVKSKELIYVGLSRAKHHLIIIGDLPVTRP